MFLRQDREVRQGPSVMSRTSSPHPNTGEVPAEWLRTPLKIFTALDLRMVILA